VAGLLRAGRALAGSRRATFYLAGKPERGHGPRIDASSHLDALLPLEGADRVTRAHIDHAGRLAGEEALLDQHLLHLDDLLAAQIERRHGPAARAAVSDPAARTRVREARSRADWKDGDHLVTAVDDDDVVVGDGE